MLPFIHKGKAAYRFHIQKSQNLEVITVHRYLVADVIRALMADQPNNFFKQQAVGGLEKVNSPSTIFLFCKKGSTQHIL